MTRPRIEFEDILRWFAIAGTVALLAVFAVAGFGFATRTLVPVYTSAVIKFLFAVLLVTAPYAELLERREQRLRRMSLEERLGFVPHGDPAR
jgi:hypothetical protein